MTLVALVLAALLSVVTPQNIVGGGPMAHLDDIVGDGPMAQPYNIVGGGPMVVPPPR